MGVQYDVTKEVLNKLFQKTENIAKSMSIESINKQVSEIKDKFSNNAFYLVVLGQFKRGKSTFINYILGDNILPTGIVPLTSVITKVYYSEDVSVNILYNDGKTEDITIQQLHLYCTEEGNPKNIKGINEIRIGYPFDFIRDDIIVIDTPGIGSVYKHNTDVAYGYINKADAVIFMLSVDPPISEVEIEFLYKISENVDKIFFLLNKIDYVSELELQKILEFTKNIVKNITNNDDIVIYPISSKMALEGKILKDARIIEKSGIKKFEINLSNFLKEEKEKILIKNFIKNIERILSMCETFLESNMKLRLMPLERLENNVKMFNEFIEKVERSKKEISILFKGELNDNILQKFDEKMDEFKKLINKEISGKIKTYHYNIRRLNRIKQKNELERYLEKAIIDEFERLRVHIEKDIEKQYNEILLNYSSKINSIIDDIRVIAKELFGINLEYFRGPDSITAESKFTYKIGYDVGALEIDPVYFTYFLPKAIAEGIILKRVLNRIEVDVDRNIGRIRYDLLRRMEESFNAFEEDMHSKIKIICDIVKELVDKSMMSYNLDKSNFEKERDYYDMLLSNIEEIKKELNLIDADI